MSSKLWLLGLLIPTVTVAQDKYFTRYERLASTFPAAFSEYTQRQYLVPTYPARWSKGRFSTELIIKARLTRVGLSDSRINDDKPELTATIESVDGSELTVAAPRFDPAFPSGYAWRILLSEILLRYPQTSQITFVNTGLDGVFDLGHCSELLAQGIDAATIAQALPLTVAMKKFGFSLTEFRPVRDVKDDVNRYYIGEFEFYSTFVRDQPP